VLILRALLADALGDREAALGWLAAAVGEAEPEGVIRPFPELRVARDGREPAGGTSPAFLGTLLAAFPGREQGGVVVPGSSSR
jgi:hypothetical protein